MELSFFGVGLNKGPILLERLDNIKAAYMHADGQSPEETALTKIVSYAQKNGLTKQSGARLFGRNTYPSDAPEPHGYEYYLTIDNKAKSAAEVLIKDFPGGLYAVLEVKDLCNLTQGWQDLFAWANTSGHQAVGLGKGEHGWFNSAFEELENWSEGKAPNEWVFRLWLKLKE